MNRLCNLTEAALDVLYRHRGLVLLRVAVSSHFTVAVRVVACCRVETSVPASAAYFIQDSETCSGSSGAFAAVGKFQY